MPDATTKPVIFLAFANDRDDTVGYLRNLPVERKRLSKVLDKAEQDGLCEVVVKPDCTASEIFEVFQDARYRNRIAIFHFGGHANGYQLLLESAEGKAAAADAGGLAKFLGQQQGLQLVFLNGCSTQQQTRELLDANISAVISTSRSIDDQVATDFAWQFYQGLSGGATIRTSYNEAEASVQTAKGGNTRGLYFGASDDSKSQFEADRWPWNLHLREGSENADHWNLPEAVNDPLFGLPPLPEQDLPESPYRHLNWFTRKDAEVFFGRGHQIRELYDRLTAPRTAPIMLFYGQSGVGKSSILDAGLIPRLEQNYEVRYLRRGEGGLLDTLQLAFLPEASDVPIETAWRVKEEQAGKPLIVFLDQVEELYTRPMADLPNELGRLLDVVKATFVDSTQRPRGKLVLGFRKEWLAELESQLVAYELPRSKMFLEPLDRRGIIEVVLGPACSDRLRERYGLTVEEGLAEIIAADLVEDQGSAIGPTLQILLTKLWSQARIENDALPRFSHALYQQLKRDGILLRDFLNQQIAAIRQRYPEAVNSGLLLDIMAMHTSPLGTADQCSAEQLEQQYAHLGDKLPALLQECQDQRLLTVAASAQQASSKATRLAHDTLAPLVREQFDVSDKPGQRARRILDNRSVDWVGDRVGTPLDEADLAVVEQGVAGTRALNATEQRLLQRSREVRARLRRNRKTLKIIAAIAALLIAILGAFGWYSNAKAIARNQELDQEKKKAYLKVSDLEFLQGTIAQSTNRHVIKAGHNHLRAAQFAQMGDDENRKTSALIASAADSTFVAATYLHDGGVKGVSFSQDESRVLTWSTDKTARLWDATSGRPIHTLQHEGSVNGGSFSHNEGRVLTWSEDDTARLWNATNGNLLQTFKHKRVVGPIWGGIFSPDDSRVLTWSFREATLWNEASENPIQTFAYEDEVGGGLFNNDGSQILIWAGETAQLWSATNDQPIRTFTDHGSVVGGAFSQDQSHVLTWSNGRTVSNDGAEWRDHGTVWLWDANSGQPVRTITCNLPITSALFSKDESRVLTWRGDDKAAQLWDTTDGQSVWTFSHEDRITGGLFNTDGSRVLTWSWDKTARLWDATSGNRIHNFTHEGPVQGGILSHDGTHVLTWSANAVRLWDTSRGELVQTFAHEDAVQGCSFSADDSRVLTCSWDKTARLWNVNGGKSIQTFAHDHPVHGGLFSIDDARVLTWSNDDPASNGDTARLRDATSGQTIQTFSHKHAVNSGVFSRDKSRILTWSDDTVQLWDVTSGLPMRTFEHQATVNGGAFSKDESRLLTWSNDSTARLWNANSGEVINSLQHDRTSTLGGMVTGATFTKDETRLLTWSRDGTAGLWDANDGRRIGTFSHSDVVTGAMFSKNESRILTWSEDATAKLWNAATGQEIWTLTHDGCVIGSSFSHDDGRVLTWSDDGTARLWNVTTGQSIQTLQHEKQVSGGLFTRDDLRVLTWSEDTAARLWDATNGQPIHNFTHQGSVWGGLFNQDESRILTWSEDKTARLWDAASGQPIQTLSHTGGVSGGLFSHDESRILTWSYDRTARLWNIGVELGTPVDSRLADYQLLTGTKVDASGAVRVLTFEEREELRRRQAFEGRSGR